MGAPIQAANAHGIGKINDVRPAARYIVHSLVVAADNCIPKIPRKAIKH